MEYSANLATEQSQEIQLLITTLMPNSKKKFTNEKKRDQLIKHGTNCQHKNSIWCLCTTEYLCVFAATKQ